MVLPTMIVVWIVKFMAPSPDELQIDYERLTALVIKEALNKMFIFQLSLTETISGHV